MSNIPDNLKYTKDHEWILIEGDIGTIGITDYAQESLGDVTFVDLPAVGESYSAGETFGVVESVKAASDLYMPIAGEVVEINEGLADAPENVNSDPYGAAWMLKIRIENAEELNTLLDAADYEKLA